MILHIVYWKCKSFSVSIGRINTAYLWMIEKGYVCTFSSILSTFFTVMKNYFSLFSWSVVDSDSLSVMCCSIWSRMLGACTYGFIKVMASSDGFKGDNCSTSVATSSISRFFSKCTSFISGDESSQLFCGGVLSYGIS